MTASSPPLARRSSSRLAGAPPPVSLVVLTYNQARFVPEAVESALAQDYANLEIILSDHGSTDGTFEIMAQMAAEYRGRHKVHLRRSRSPLGVLGHAFEAIDLSSGELIVGASGDDVSRSDRVTLLAERWQESGAAVLCSATEAVDAGGNRILRGRSWPLAHDISRYFPDGDVFHIRGASTAYDRRALDALPRPDFPVMSEDHFLGLMLAVSGARFERLDEPLVRYRIHAVSLSSRGGTLPTLSERERATASYSTQAARILGFARTMAAKGACRTGRRIDLAELETDLAFHEARANWAELGLVRRIAALRHARSGSKLRWMLPRIFGWRFLSMLQRGD